MSLYDVERCANCGHARHWHATRHTKYGYEPMHCKHGGRGHCDCPAFVEDVIEPRAAMPAGLDNLPTVTIKPDPLCEAPVADQRRRVEHARRDDR